MDRMPRRNSSSGGENSSSHVSFSVRRWIERCFVLLIGVVIAFCISQTKQLGELLRDVDMEEMNVPRGSSWWVKKDPFDLLTGVKTGMSLEGESSERVLKERAIMKEVMRENAKASGDMKEPKQNWAKLLKDLTKVGDDEKTSNKDDLETGDEKTSNKDDPRTDRLNIVLFYADDWTMKILGKLDPHVRTPNIDQMADNGMLFLNNCVTTSVCWISRATLMTGTYYARHLHAAPFTDTMFKTHNWNETLFPKLRKAGYYTGLTGKWHALSPREYLDKAFDKSNLYYGKHWEPDGDRMIHVTEKNRWTATDFLHNRPKDKNFALKVSFFATHAEDGNIPSYKPMNWSRMELYPDNSTEEYYQTIVPSKTATEKHWNELPYFLNQELNCGRIRWKKRWEPDVWQKNIRDLMAMATEVDWAIGEIIDVLKQQGVYNNTLLVFTTDNGDLHGEHGLAEKWYPLEESIRVPLVIQDPRMPAKSRGRMNEDWTLNVDLAPTLLGAAGIEPASFMQGRDIAQLYLANATAPSDSKWKENLRQYDTKEAKKPWRTEWFYEWNIGDPINATGHAQDGFIDAAFALITNEWKYVYWPLKVYEQLFHRSLDLYDEYDILQNYYLFHYKEKNKIWVNSRERRHMEFFTPKNTTPYGDSVESTKEIYKTMKQKYEALKKHVQSGGKI